MSAYDAMAGYIYELDTDVFAETIPETYQTFLETLEKYEIDTESLGLAIDCDDWSTIDNELTEEAGEACIDEIENAYKQVKRMFEAKTGLQIALTTIDSGSVYNEVQGPVWAVLNATQPTEPARVFERFIDQKFFSHYG